MRIPTSNPSVLVAAIAVIAACGGDDAPSQPADAAVDTAIAVDAMPDAALPPNTTLTTHVGAVAQNVSWVGAQIGSGPWHRVEGTNGTYGIYVASGRYGFAWTCVYADYVDVHVLWATREELAAASVTCIAENAPDGDVTGTVTGIGTNERARVIGCEEATEFTDTTYALTTPQGTCDFIAIRENEADSAWPLGRPDEFILRRDVVVGATAQADFDFSAVTNPFELHTYSVTTGESIGAFQRFISHHGAYYSNQRFAATTGQYAAVPVAAQMGNDINELMVFRQEGAGTDVQGRSVVRRFKTPVDQMFTLPPMFSSPAFDAASSTPYLRPRITFDKVVGADLYELRVDQSHAGWYVWASSGWLANASIVEVPDLSAASGWNNAWGPMQQGTLQWFATAIASNVPLEHTVRFLIPFPDRYTPSSDDDGLEVARSSKQALITF